MRNQKGFAFLEFLIVIAIIGVICVIATLSFKRATFTDNFGFDPKPMTTLKQELVREHLNVLERACGSAVKREHEFNTNPVTLTPDQGGTLELRVKAQTAQTNSFCRLHASADSLARHHGYEPVKQ